MIKQPEAMSRPQAPVWDHRSLSSPFWSKLKLLHDLQALEEGGGCGGVEGVGGVQNDRVGA